MTLTEMLAEKKKIEARAAIDSAGTDTLSELKAIGARYNQEIAELNARYQASIFATLSAASR